MRPERVGDLAEAEEAGVRVGRVGEPLEHHRQQRPLDRRGPRDPAGQRLEVAQRRLRVEVAERRQPGPGRLRAQPAVPAGDAGDGLEQRPVEQLLVQPAYLAAVLAQRPLQLGDRVLEVAQRPAEAAQRRLVLRDHVRTPELVQLHAVLDGPQEAVGVVEGGPLLAADVAARRSARRAPRAWSAGGSASSAWPCTICSSWTANSTSRSPPEPSLICRSASLAGMCSRTRRRIACTSATKPSRWAAFHTSGLIVLDVVLAQRQVAGDRPRLEQRLELPGLRPALVVAEVARRACAPAARPCPRGAARRRPARSCPRRCGRSRPSSGARRAGWRSAAPACSSCPSTGSATKITSTSLT